MCGLSSCDSQALERGLSGVDRGLSSVERGLSSVERGLSSVERRVSSVERGLSSVERGLSSVEAGLSSVVHKLSCSTACGSSGTREATSVPCIARHILDHWTTREAPEYFFNFFFFPQQFITM